MEFARVFHLKILRNRFKSTSFVVLRHCSVTVRGAKCGSDGFLEDFRDSHLETSQLQKALLGLGSALVSIADPRRGDMIAAMGETTGLNSLEYVKSKMLESEEGRRILTEKPRITSGTVDLNKLEALPDGTVGKAYFKFLKKYNYTPDARLAVRFVDDVELAYVIQRYREVHDMFHTVLDMPTNMLGEVTVKWVEAIQTRLPMCIGGALFGAARLAPKYCRHYSTARKPEVTIDPSLQEIPGKSQYRRHPGIRSLRCVEVPDTIQEAIHSIVKERNLPDVVEQGEKLRNYLHSRKPPPELEDLRSKKRKILEEVRNKFPSNDVPSSQDEQEYVEKVVKGKVNSLMKSRNYQWKPLVMNDTLSYFYMVGRTAAEYAVICRVFNEIYVRDRDFSPRNIFDFGSGVGTVSWVAHNLWAKSLQEYFTVDSSSDMNDLARLILQLNDPQREPFVHQLFQRQFLPATPRQYDLVVSAYSLIELNSLRSRAEIISNLWAKTNKYLVLVEQGTNAGFQLINEARDLVTHLEEGAGRHCHVFAPCPHELPCPRAQEAPSTPCNFTTTFSPLRHLATNSKTKQERFSFVILKRGKRDEDVGVWPRIVRDVQPRHKHVICRMCTASGRLEEVIFTAAKHGKDVYRCARYSSWGDLVPVSLKYDESNSEEND